MPFPRSLSQYMSWEFEVQAPDPWVARLREVSPVRDDLDHLVFRYFSPTEPNGEDRGWAINDRPIWTLYRAKPIKLITKDRADQFLRHWSMCHVAQHAGLKALVSEYQFFMWHSRGLYVEPFLILQGQWGGTPAKYTEAEEAFLKASDMIDEPYPIGMFPACPFDERVVTQIANRDRLLQCANDLGALGAMDSPDALRAATNEAQRIKRETYLDTYRIMMQPTIDFVKSEVGKRQYQDAVRPAPEGLDNKIGMWREHFLEHGHVVGASPAVHRQVY